ncbi:hypothetical protein ATANTOWER_021534, partial [Ataeniobius toweri]|nr:hypothetical protein [Ataeniobius toweri]
CNFNQCAAPLICPLGFELNITNGTCCQSYKCVPKGVCVYDMTEFKLFLFHVLIFKRGGGVLSVGRHWDSRAELNSWLWPAEACRCLPEDSLPEEARVFCEDARSIGFHKNSSRLLRPEPEGARGFCKESPGSLRQAVFWQAAACFCRPQPRIELGPAVPAPPHR